MRFRKINPWISWGLAATFLLAMVSGVVVSYPYKEEHPLVSTVGIETVVPFGNLFRAFHYFSGQFTLLLAIWHTIEAMLSHAQRRRPWWAWSCLILSMTGVLLILFTGYIIRGDQTGFAAGHIAENLASSIPILGKIIDHLFFLVSKEGVHRAWLTHVYLSFLLFFLIATFHLRIEGLRSVDLAAWTSVYALFSLLIPASLHAYTEATLIKGPWFFLGVQELLRYLPPLIAGVIFPSIPALALILFYKWPRVSSVVLGIWFLVYSALTIMGALR